MKSSQRLEVCHSLVTEETRVTRQSLLPDMCHTFAELSYVCYKLVEKFAYSVQTRVIKCCPFNLGTRVRFEPAAVRSLPYTVWVAQKMCIQNKTVLI